MKSFLAAVSIAGVLFSFSPCAGKPAVTTNTSTLCPTTFAYPVAFRNQSVATRYFGHEIADPYRWLEHPDSESTKAFVNRQNDVTRKYLRSYEHYSDVKQMVTSLRNYSRYDQLDFAGDGLHYSFNSGLQNHSVLYYQRLVENFKNETVFDPNQYYPDGNVALTYSEWSENGKYAGLMLSTGGSDWKTIRILDVESNQLLNETLERVKFSSLTWTRDNAGFFHSMYPDAGESQTTGNDSSANLNQKVYYHRAGTAQSEHVLCAEFPEHPSWHGSVEVSESDGRFAVMTITRSTEAKNDLWFCDLEKLDGGITGILPWRVLFDKFDAQYHTNLDAPNHKIVLFDIEKPEKANWQILVPENPKYSIVRADIVFHDKLILAYLEDVKNTMYMVSLQDGKMLYTFEIGINTVTQLTGKAKHPYIFYKLESFIDPGTIYMIDLSKSTSSFAFREATSGALNTKDYESKQLFYTSAGDVKIPMTILHRKGLELTPETPCLLYGYGGFHTALLPSFSVRLASFVKAFDGILAVANVRGGTEFGEKWWEQGSLKNKQNSFTDFENAAVYLQTLNYTRKNKLTILGGSNGGLLVGASSNQRTDLFGAAIPIVGVMDLLRFGKFTIGQYWTSDFGDPDVEEDFDVLIKYSPLHNIHQQKYQYPATLVLTADHDDRVPPLHSLKYIAELQHTLCDDHGTVNQTNPLMIRVETNSGHGGGTTTKDIEETTDIMVFCAKALGYDWKVRHHMHLLRLSSMLNGSGHVSSAKAGLALLFRSDGPCYATDLASEQGKMFSAFLRYYGLLKYADFVLSS